MATYLQICCIVLGLDNQYLVYRNDLLPEFIYHDTFERQSKKSIALRIYFIAAVLQANPDEKFGRASKKHESVFALFRVFLL